MSHVTDNTWFTCMALPYHQQATLGLCEIVYYASNMYYVYV